jgi:RNA polymerase sigma-70 factor (ECF subfamily)
MGVTELDDAVRDAFRAGSEAWVGLALTVEAFGAWVEKHAISVDSLRSRGADLYLAVACAAGDERALALFDREFLQTLGPILKQARLEADQLQELRQRLRVHVLTGPNPRIALFQGHGPLAAWLRVAAARMAVQMLGARPLGGSNDALIDALEHAGADPELVSARREHQAEFRAALEDCISGLAARDKTLLRMSFLDDMNIDDIGVVYRVHRATVARWLVAIRRQISDGVCQRLSIKLHSSPSEVASLVRLVRSEVDLSFSRLLAQDQGDEAEGAAAAPPRDQAGGD